MTSKKPEVQYPLELKNLPFQARKIFARKGAVYNLMVTGEPGLGKTTFINNLFRTKLVESYDISERYSHTFPHKTKIEITRTVLTESGFSLRLNIIKTEGFGDSINNESSIFAPYDFITDQYESYLKQEMQPDRSAIKDLRVHACVYFIRPNSLTPLDILSMKRLSKIVNLIPVIARADTLTEEEKLNFKERVSRAIEEQDITVFTPALEPSDPTTVQERVKDIIRAMPFCIMCSEHDVMNKDGKLVKGRQYIWGTVFVDDETHNDFKRLRRLLIRQCLLDLIQATDEIYYEAYRSTRMEAIKNNQLEQRQLSPLDMIDAAKMAKWSHNPEFKEQEEKLRKRYKILIEDEEERFTLWEKNLKLLRDDMAEELGKLASINRGLELDISDLRELQLRKNRRARDH